MDGWWECEALDTFFYTILRHEVDKKIGTAPAFVANVVKSTLFNRQNNRKAHEVAEKHYDAGNDLFTRMLDSRMNTAAVPGRMLQTSRRPRPPSST